MEKLAALPIDWANVDWPYVVGLVFLVFIWTVIGTTLGFGRALPSAILSALLFATAFVFWTYYPHSLPTSIKAEKAPQTSPSPPPATTEDHMKPGNAMTTISPPPANYQPR